MKLRNLLSLAMLVCASMSTVVAKNQLTPLSPERVAEIEAMLSDKTIGYGEPIDNREAWDSLAALEVNRTVIEHAEKLLDAPMPQWQSELYEYYRASGIRRDADLMFQSRYPYVSPLVLAECLENEGRFIEGIEQTILNICEQPTWVLVAHDTNLDNLYGRRYHVDLGAARLSDLIAQSLYLVGDKLNPLVVKVAMETLQTRIFDPMLESIRSAETGRHGWMISENNWNFVCWAGTTNAALAVIEDKHVRAEFVAAAERYVQCGLDSFLDDGYYEEGVSYFNYGFSRFIRLREALYRATEGELDLFAHPRMAKIATYGSRSEIINNLYPGISDCRLNLKPSSWIKWYCYKAFGWEGAPKVSNSFSGVMTTSLITNFTNAPCKLDKGEVDGDIGLRSDFEIAGVLTCRPYKDEWDSAMGVAIKCGSNDESHNHNDVASFTLVAGNEYMAGDVGGPKNYNSETFSNLRYTRKYPIFSSFGHPLPIYGGVEQYASPKAVGKVLSKKFTNKRDEIKYDILSTYPNEKLKSATREFIYNRAKSGELTVIDSFSADEPITFETAITTIQDVETTKGGKRLLIKGKNNEVEVEIVASEPFTISFETLECYAVDPYSRASVHFTKPVKKGTVKLIYRLKK